MLIENVDSLATGMYAIASLCSFLSYTHTVSEENEHVNMLKHIHTHTERERESNKDSYQGVEE